MLKTNSRVGFFIAEPVILLKKRESLEVSINQISSIEETTKVVACVNKSCVRRRESYTYPIRMEGSFRGRKSIRVMYLRRIWKYCNDDRCTFHLLSSAFRHHSTIPSFFTLDILIIIWKIWFYQINKIEGKIIYFEYILVYELINQGFPFRINWKWFSYLCEGVCVCMCVWVWVCV